MDISYEKQSMNDLQEASDLLGRLSGLINQEYCHVNEVGTIPAILKMISEEWNHVENEIDKRWDEDEL